MFKQLVVVIGNHQLITILVILALIYLLMKSLKYTKKVFGDEDYANCWVRSLVLPSCLFVFIAMLTILFLLSLSV